MKQFLDYDKNKTKFFLNLFLEESKLVVKIPIIEKSKKKNYPKIEQFNLTKYTYLTHLE